MKTPRQEVEKAVEVANSIDIIEGRHIIGRKHMVTFISLAQSYLKGELVGKEDKLTKEEFHSILSEFPPSIAEDSGQPEWTQGEIDKLWNFLIGKNRWIEYDRAQKQLQSKYMSVEEVEKIVDKWEHEWLPPLRNIEDGKKELAQALTRLPFAPNKIVRTTNNEIIAITYEGKQYYPKELHPAMKLALTREELLVIIKNAIFQCRGGENMAEKIADTILATRLPKGVER